MTERGPVDGDGRGLARTEGLVSEETLTITLIATDSPKYSIVSVCTITELLQTCGTAKSQISSLLLTRLSVLSFNLLGLYQFFLFASTPKMLQKK